MAGSPHEPTAQSSQSAQSSQPEPAGGGSQPGQPLPQYEAEETRTVTNSQRRREVAGRCPAASGITGPGRRERGERRRRPQVVRYGPGVPARARGPGRAHGRAGLADRAAERARPPAPAAPLVGPALSVALLVASGAVIYLRLHHGPFGVTGVAITAQARNGCTEDVTGRVDTTGAAGTISYQWVFEPRLTAPQPLSQPIASRADRAVRDRGG